MKERFVDFALLIALGIIGLAIVFTLVNLGRDRTPSGATAPAPTQTAQTDVSPTEPAGVAASQVASPEGVTPTETGAEAVTSADATADNSAELTGGPANEAAGTEAAEVATPVEVIPALVDAAEGNADNSVANSAVVGGVPDGAVEADAATGGVSGGEDATATASTTASSTLPTGTEALSRIGFNFATGQEGACSIPLEPWQHIAVSRDLLAEYGCGARVTVTLPEPINGREEVTAVIADTMGPAAQQTVNIYVSPDEPAFDYGLLEGGSVRAATASP